MARLTYGGSIADFVFMQDGDTSDMETATSGTVITFYDALTGGNLYAGAPSPDDGTGLTDTNGNPIDSVTVDDDGFIPEFRGPDISATSVTRMAADASGGAGPRRWVTPNDPLSVAQMALQAAQAAQANSANSMQVAYYNAVAGAYPNRPQTSQPVRWVGPSAPAFGSPFAIDGLDFWDGPVS